MENKYIHNQFMVIKSLIKEQREFSDMLDGDESDFGEASTAILHIQEQINEVYDRIQCAKGHAITQRMYIQQMVNAPKQIEDGRRSEKGDYCFITVNPPDDLPFMKLVNAVNQFVNLSVVKGYQYVFEQRGKVRDDYRGFHTHILFERSSKPSFVEKEIHRIFDPLVPQLPCINIRWVISKDDVKNHIKYITGGKKKPEKADAMKNNIYMRLAFHLEPLYVGKSPLLVSDLPVGVCLLPEEVD